MIKPDFTQLIALHDELKKQLLTFIQDKTIPLDERFAVWQAAPVTMKEHKTFTESFAGLPDDYVMYDGHVHADRHKTIKISDILEAAEGSYGEESQLSPENLILFKEDVLTKNINSFVYDW